MILELADIKHTKVYSAVDNDASYIDDDRVKEMYYYPLARDFNIDIANLPADIDINEKIKRYLALSVYITVGEDHIGMDQRQIAENISVDLWSQLIKTWKTQLTALKGSMTASDIYDPANPPTDITKSPFLKTWERA